MERFGFQMQSGDAIRVIEGQHRGKEGFIVMPIALGADVTIDGLRHWFYRAEIEQVVTL